MDTSVFPPGIKFKPSDQELIGYYLTRKLSDQLRLPSFIQILDRQMYGKLLPWEVLKDDHPWYYTWKDGWILKQKETYVFSRLIQSGNKKRAMRTAGSGTWGGKQVSHNIKYRQNVSGKMRSFTFYKNDGVLQPDKGRWRMHEYSIDNTDLVICRIIVDDFHQSTTAADQFIGHKRKYSDGDQQTVEDHDGSDHKRMREKNIDDEVITGLDVSSMPVIIDSAGGSTRNEKVVSNGDYESFVASATSAKVVSDVNQCPPLGELMNEEDVGLDSWANDLEYELEKNTDDEVIDGQEVVGEVFSMPKIIDSAGFSTSNEKVVSDGDYEGSIASTSKATTLCGDNPCLTLHEFTNQEDFSWMQALLEGDTMTDSDPLLQLDLDESGELLYM